jgi:hypothetical protein
MYQEGERQNCGQILDKKSIKGTAKNPIIGSNFA